MAQWSVSAGKVSLMVSSFTLIGKLSLFVIQSCNSIQYCLKLQCQYTCINRLDGRYEAQSDDVDSLTILFLAVQQVLNVLSLFSFAARANSQKKATGKKQTFSL